MTSNKSLIIDLRSQLQWHQRMLTDIFTALLWGVWFYLWRPITSLLMWIHSWSSLLRPTSAKFFYSGVFTLEGFVSLVGTASLLMLWSLLPKRNANTQNKAHTIEESADYFGLTIENLKQGQNAKTCVVFHDEFGRITQVEIRN